MAEHHYVVAAEWTGNTGQGNATYRDYERSVTLSIEGKPNILSSADHPFRGDRAKWNPEDFLVASLVECHMLSYLYAALKRGVVVTSYRDEGIGIMQQEGEGGHFSDVLLRPQITVADESMLDDAHAAHIDANKWCFIANSVNFPVRHEPTITVG